MEPMMKETTDIVLSEDGKRILASRFIIQGYEIKDLEEDKKMIEALRKVCDESPFDASIYHPTFVYHDQVKKLKMFGNESNKTLCAYIYSSY